MIVSRGEIVMTLWKAARSYGWPPGLAEDIAGAGAALAQHGFDGVGVAVEAMGSGYAPAQAEKTSDGWIFRNARVCAAGPSALDLLAAAGKASRITLAGTDPPFLLAGFAAAAADTHGEAYELRFAGGSHARIGTTIFLSGPLPAAGEESVLTRAGPAETARPMADEIEVADPVWTAAMDAAARTLVAATEASHARGAGAGLIDND